MKYSKHDFEKAFENNELSHYFQGVIDMYTEEVSSFELLARWEHPEHGFLSSGDFIKDLQAHGFEHTLTELAVARVVDYYENAKLQSLDAPPVSVNVTPSEMESPQWANRLIAEIERVKLPPRLLRIEMLEWGQSEQVDALVKVVEQLKAYGIGVYADDFGNAYNSFHRLLNIPFTGLKLDSEYVGAIRSNPNAARIIEAMANYCKKAGLDFIVEGVETLEQALAIQALGVVNAQGYYYDTPCVTVEALTMLPINIDPYL